LSQDVFLKAYQNLGKLENAERFGPWLFRIAHNEAFSFFRSRRPEDELPAESAPAPSRLRMYPAELSVAVEAALGRLSDEQREAVVLKVYEGFKFEEMAAALDCPVSTVKSRLYTALDVLKEALAPISSRGVQ
jgi:RNA polymerase sigma-70 factor (ECF subfamily)